MKHDFYYYAKGQSEKLTRFMQDIIRIPSLSSQEEAVVQRMAAEMGVAFLGRVPLDPAVGAACDAGKPFVLNNGDSETARAFGRVLARLLGPEPRSAL